MYEVKSQLIRVQKSLLWTFNGMNIFIVLLGIMKKKMIK